MPDTYAKAILTYLSKARDASTLKPRQLARQLGVDDEQYSTFREAVKALRDSGRIVLGAHNAITLPSVGSQVVGYYRPNPKGFGFVVPEDPNAHGDLFVPAGKSGGALTGDKVLANVSRKGQRDGKLKCDGEIITVLERNENRFVGELQATGEMHFILPEGRKFQQPILLRDVGAAGPKLGTKVVVEIVEYGGGDRGQLPAGVIVETLGQPGELEVETLAMIRAHGLREQFPPEATANAREMIDAFDPEAAMEGREDISGRTIVTIDPDDARDYDDAICIRHNDDGTWALGIHIADVSHFVQPGSALDEEAIERGTSTYFPRLVLPMLPEILSNGVCSLQEGEPRFVKSCTIRYDAEGNVTGSRLSESVMRSAKRLTYGQAQAILDAKTDDEKAATAKEFELDVIRVVRDMQALAQIIERRRRKAGMIHLDLPAIELVLDDDGKVIDAVKEDDAYTHTIIEMFMVEANEAVGRTLRDAGRKFLRRIHADPDEAGGQELSAFIGACGLTMPESMGPREIQQLLARVKGTPESYAINLAVLKTFQQAEYSPMEVGHFALASDCYCHFTSPIRRYPDLTVHRLVERYCREGFEGVPADDVASLIALGEKCNAASKRSEAAEDELRNVLILQFLATKVGEEFEGVITGVTNFGLFVQWPQFLVEGLVKLEDLGDDWWDLAPGKGAIHGERTGKRYRLGDHLDVKVTSVDVARRQLNLMPAQPFSADDESGDRKPRKKGPGGKTSHRKSSKSSAKSKPRTRRGNSRKRRR